MIIVQGRGIRAPIPPINALVANRTGLVNRHDGLAHEALERFPTAPLRESWDVGVEWLPRRIAVPGNPAWAYDLGQRAVNDTNPGPRVVGVQDAELWVIWKVSGIDRVNSELRPIALSTGPRPPEVVGSACLRRSASGCTATCPRRGRGGGHDVIIFSRSIPLPFLEVNSPGKEPSLQSGPCAIGVHVECPIFLPIGEFGRMDDCRVKWRMKQWDGRRLLLWLIVSRGRHTEDGDRLIKP